LGRASQAKDVSLMQTLLDAREYKLLLDGRRFKGAQPAAVVAALWQQRIIPIIANRLDATKSGKPRHRKEFAETERRQVRFYDTGARHLSDVGFSLRERAEQPAAGLPELTLKLRTPDLLIAAATDLPGVAADAKSKFEEDIAPLIVAAGGPGHETHVCAAVPATSWSRFSVSTKQQCTLPVTLADLFAHYPTLATHLKGLGSEGPAPAHALAAGAAITELLFSGAEVDFSEQAVGRFSVTLWYFAPTTDVPAVAEISYKCKLQEGATPLMSAHRAATLFRALQEDLADIVDKSATSKTALALPPRTAI
jgi:hypothetical protein